MRLDEIIGDEKFDSMLGSISNNAHKVDLEKNPHMTAAKFPSVDFKNAFNYVKQCITNATINVPPYNSPEFRIDRINEAIRRLEILRDYLSSDSAIGKASKR